MSNPDQPGRDRSAELDLLFGDKLVNRQATYPEGLTARAARRAPSHEDVDRFMSSAGNHMDRGMIGRVDLIEVHRSPFLLMNLTHTVSPAWMRVASRVATAGSQTSTSPCVLVATQSAAEALFETPRYLGSASTPAALYDA
jgi:hypothetical protein